MGFIRIYCLRFHPVAMYMKCPSAVIILGNSEF